MRPDRDQAACQFTRDGRCTGPTTSSTSHLDVLDALTCGNKASFDAAVDSPGEVSAPYVSIGRTQTGTEWEVDSLLPPHDRIVIKPGRCAAPATADPS